MILGYVISGKSSNNELFFDGNEPPGVLCPNCGTCLNYQYAPTKISVHPSQRYDVSYTHDLRRLFSLKFVEFCQDELGCDDKFHLVSNEGRELFYMFPSRVIEFDVEKRKTRFEKLCGICGGYESVVGARPAFIRSKSQIGPGFYRSDIAFATGKSKFPLFFVSVEWQKLIAAQKFRGIDFEQITD